MEQNSLFQNDVQKDPLAARLRPASLQDYVGQKHLLGKGKILYNLIEKDMVSSMIFWGPPGVGKTTLARIIARQTQAHFINFSAVTSGIVITKEVLEQCTSQKSLLYERQGEEHYNLISALHKSMRNSDVDAAIYWLARMLEAGEDPLYVARRLVRFASEDIGMADSRALEICVAVYQACHFLGMPECNVHLTHAVTYLSLSPKSNALYMAYGAAKEDAVHMLSEPVPLQIRNAPTSLMKDLHYGEGYQYAHDTQEKLTNMECMPESLKGREYYHPTIREVKQG